MQQHEFWQEQAQVNTSLQFWNLYTGSQSGIGLILQFSYKALHGLVPHYLTELFTVYAPSRDLHFSDTGLLALPSTCLRSIGYHAFSFCAPRIWNSLPIKIRQADSFSVFKSALKIHFFFRIAFRWFYFFMVFSLSVFYLILSFFLPCYSIYFFYFLLFFTTIMRSTF